MHDPLAAPGIPPRSVMVDVTLGVVVAAAAVVEYPRTPVTIAVGVLVAVAVACRRIAPSIMMPLALISAALQVGFLQVAVIPSLAYALLFFVAGGSAHQAVRRISLAVAIAGSAVAAWTLIHRSVSEFGNDPGVLDFAAAYAGSAIVVVGGWTYGFTRYQRRTVEEARVAETIAELERRRLLELYDEQAERSRLARDMHDVVAHSLAVVVAQAEGARFALDASPEAAREALGVIAQTARQALADVRGVLEELRSTESTAEAARIDRDQLFDRMRAAGMMLQSTEIGDENAVSALDVRVAFAVLTEALTNALKYGDMTRPVHVRQDWTDGCRLSVANALSAAPLAPGGAGHGITGMIERAELAGGTLTSAAVEDGWLVELTIPARPEGLS